MDGGCGWLVNMETSERGWIGMVTGSGQRCGEEKDSTYLWWLAWTHEVGVVMGNVEVEAYIICLCVHLLSAQPQSHRIFQVPTVVSTRAHTPSASMDTTGDCLPDLNGYHCHLRVDYLFTCQRTQSL